MSEPIVSLLCILLIACWFVVPFLQRRKFPCIQYIDIEEVPSIYRKEVDDQINDGYKLSSVSESDVILIKRKVLWFPLIFSVLTGAWPFVLASQYVSGVYCIRLTATGDEIECETF